VDVGMFAAGKRAGEWKIDDENVSLAPDEKVHVIQWNSDHYEMSTLQAFILDGSRNHGDTHRVCVRLHKF
jgi:hypothetical protein